MNHSFPDTQRLPQKPTLTRPQPPAHPTRPWKAGGSRRRSISSDGRGRHFCQLLIEQSLDREHTDATLGLLVGALLGCFIWAACLATFLSIRG